jgi:hypothetical protein
LSEAGGSSLSAAPIASVPKQQQQQRSLAASAEADDEYPRSLGSGDMLNDRQLASASSSLQLTANPMFAAAAVDDSAFKASSAFVKQDPDAPGSLGRAFGRRSGSFGGDAGAAAGVRRVGSAPDLASMAEEAARGEAALGGSATTPASPSMLPVSSSSSSPSPARAITLSAVTTDSDYSSPSLNAPSLSASSISIGAQRRSSRFGAGFGGAGAGVDSAATPFQSATLATGVEYADAITAQSTGSAMVCLSDLAFNSVIFIFFLLVFFRRTCRM